MIRPSLPGSPQWAGAAASTVRLLGARADIPSLLAESGVFVLSSRYEGMPLSIIEAMRSGLPVIASRVGGVAELVEDGRTGILVAPGDVEGMKSAMRRLARRPGFAPGHGRSRPGAIPERLLARSDAHADRGGLRSAAAERRTGDDGDCLMSGPQTRNPRLAIVIHSLSGGGAERVTVHLANALAARGWSVSLITLETSDADCYQVASTVSAPGAGCGRPLRGPQGGAGGQCTAPAGTAPCLARRALRCRPGHDRGNRGADDPVHARDARTRRRV